MTAKEELLTLVPAIRRFAYSLTGTCHDADDLLQNTVEKVLSHDIPADVDLAKWVFRICRNLWIDEYRANKVRRAAVCNPELRQQEAIDGERAIYQEITLNEVNAAMATLSDEQRSILSLVALEGMSYKEVAHTLCIPVGTVMSRLARARKSLCKQINIGAFV